MGVNILNQVSAELEELQGQLKQFKSSVEYLNSAKENVRDAVHTVHQAENFHLQKLKEIEVVYSALSSVIGMVEQLSTKIDSVNFPERLTSIDNRVGLVIKEINESSKATLEELKTASQAITKADFQGRFKKLEELTNTSMSANRNHLDEGLLKSKETTEKIKGSIREMGADINMKLNEQITTLNTLNLPQRFEKLESVIAGVLSIVNSVQNRIDNMERNIADRLKDLADRQKEAQILIQTAITSATKKQQTLAYITWILIIAGIVVLYIIKSK